MIIWLINIAVIWWGTFPDSKVIENIPWKVLYRHNRVVRFILLHKADLILSNIYSVKLKEIQTKATVRQEDG